MNETQDNNGSERLKMEQRRDGYIASINQLSVEKVELVDRLAWLDKELEGLRGALHEWKTAYVNLEKFETMYFAGRDRHIEKAVENALAIRDTIPITTPPEVVEP